MSNGLIKWATWERQGLMQPLHCSVHQIMRSPETGHRQPPPLSPPPLNRTCWQDTWPPIDHSVIQSSSESKVHINIWASGHKSVKLCPVVGAAACLDNTTSKELRLPSVKTLSLSLHSASEPLLHFFFSQLHGYYLGQLISSHKIDFSFQSTSEQRLRQNALRPWEP